MTLLTWSSDSSSLFITLEFTPALLFRSKFERIYSLHWIKINYENVTLGFLKCEEPFPSAAVEAAVWMGVVPAGINISPSSEGMIFGCEPSSTAACLFLMWCSGVLLPPPREELVRASTRLSGRDQNNLKCYDCIWIKCQETKWLHFGDVPNSGGTLTSVLHDCLLDTCSPLHGHAQGLV